MTMKATAKMINMPVSTKHTVEIARQIRGKSLKKSITYLGEVIEKKKSVPMKRYNKDTAHKRGISAGRYPHNAAKEILKGLTGVINNALQKGMNPEKLVLSKIDVGQAVSQNRRSKRNTGKMTHMYIEVTESD